MPLPRKPRRTIVLTKELDDSLKSLSLATGASYSSLVVDFLTPSIPTINHIATAVNDLKRGDIGKLEAMDSINNLYLSATRTIRQLDSEILQEFGDHHD